MKKPHKPIRRAKHWGIGCILPMSGKMLAILAGVIVMGLMFSAMQAINSVVLRDIISLALAAGVLAIFYSEGLTRGLTDADASAAADRLEKEGRALSRRDEAVCWSPMKAVAACLLVFAVPLALAVYLSATAQPYTYALQDLPTWITDTYGAREDVMAPLAAYAQTVSLNAKDIIRLIVRLMELIYINLFPNPQTMIEWIDRLSPLMVMGYPIACIAGYLYAPTVWRKKQAMQRRAKKAAVRKAQKNGMAGELLGKQGEVHYGQRPQKEKKKELV